MANETENEKITSEVSSVAKNNKAFKIGLCCAAVIALIVIIVAVVMNNKPYNPEDEYVAMEMGDFKIYESEVTEYIKEFQKEYGLDSSEKWDEFLSERGDDNISARATVLNAMMECHISELFAAETGIEISEKEVENEYNEQYRMFYRAANGEGYKRVLRDSFFTDSMAKKFIKNDLVMKKYAENLEDENISDEELIEEIHNNLPNYEKLSYKDFIIVDDKFVMESVVQQLAAGADFETLKKKYCFTDTPDTGWSGLIEAKDKDSEEFYNQLSNLKAGEYTEPYQTSETSYIIGYCKATFDDIDLSSASNIPSEIKDVIKDNLQDTKKSDKIQEYKNDIAFNRGEDIVMYDPIDPEHLQY